MIANSRVLRSWQDANNAPAALNCSLCLPCVFAAEDKARNSSSQSRKMQCIRLTASANCSPGFADAALPIAPLALNIFACAVCVCLCRTNHGGAAPDEKTRNVHRTVLYSTGIDRSAQKRNIDARSLLDQRSGVSCASLLFAHERNSGTSRIDYHLQRSTRTIRRAGHHRYACCPAISAFA